MKPQSKKVVRTARQKTKLRIRKKISGTDVKPRISVFKSSKHMYVQVISDESNKTLAAASTKDKAVIEALAQAEAESGASKSTKSILAAKVVGQAIGEKMKAAGIASSVFDRNGFRYQGRVKALADGVRESGMAL